MQTGSLINLIQSKSSTVTIPEVSMGATLLMHSDRYAYTIHKVSKSKKAIWASRDETKRIDNLGMTDSGQEYTYTNNNQDKPGQWDKFTLRKDNCFHGEGTSMRGSGLKIGYRDEYYDFSF